MARVRAPVSESKFRDMSSKRRFNWFTIGMPIPIRNRPGLLRSFFSRFLSKNRFARMFSTSLCEQTSAITSSRFQLFPIC